MIVPVYRSEKTLPQLLHDLLPILDLLTLQYEVILVNDGSPDDSWRVIQELSAQYPQICGINLMRNYGQHNALLCGLRQAQYEITITMDDDLQHPPSEIVKLLTKLDEGYDVVYGTPAELPHSFWRNVSSKLTKRTLAYVMGVDSIQNINAFRAFRTSLRQAFEEYRSPNLLLDVLLSWGTAKFGAVQVQQDQRKIGVSNYSLMRLFNQTMLMLTGFSTGPLRLASFVGFVFTLFGIIVFLYVVSYYFLTNTLRGFTFLAATVALFGGAQLFAIGIIGEYLARIFSRSIERPTYVISDVLRSNQLSAPESINE